MTVKPTNCITIHCDTCGDSYGDEETGSSWHFDDVAEAIKTLDSDPDPDYDQWLIATDGAATCDDCRRKTVCDLNGHQWHTYEQWTTADGRTIPAYSYCRMCSTREVGA